MGVLRPTGFATFRRKGLDAAAGLLIHGSDRGGVHERAGLIAADIAAKSGDPFAIMRLDGSDLAADPGKLADEIQSLSLLGGRRVIWVENAGEALGKAIAPFADAGPVGNFVVAEAGSLPKSSKLRTLFEGAELLWSLPCYEDNEQDLDQLIDEELAAFEINPDAREALLAARRRPAIIAAGIAQACHLLPRASTGRACRHRSDLRGCHRFRCRRCDPCGVRRRSRRGERALPAFNRRRFGRLLAAFGGAQSQPRDSCIFARRWTRQDRPGDHRRGAAGGVFQSEGSAGARAAACGTSNR